MTLLDTNIKNYIKNSYRIFEYAGPKNIKNITKRLIDLEKETPKLKDNLENASDLADKIEAKEAVSSNESEKKWLLLKRQLILDRRGTTSRIIIVSVLTHILANLISRLFGLL